MSELLRVEGLSKRFGGVTANEDISFDVRKGEILGVIGPNGAGKSTLFDLITGFQQADSGTVILDGRDITGLRPDRIARMGVGRTFQKLKPFPDLTLLENVMVGALSRTANMHEARDLALEAISFVDLLDKRYAFARELSTGQRKRLEMARAVASGPRLLLMDEVTGGVDQKTIPGLIDLVFALRESGITVLTIEHNMQVMMQVSDRILALQSGKRIAFAKPDEVRKDPLVVDAYLGTVDAA
ncbi:MAG: ABC transporter ATP-binding protein [Proteobacteria bacterium]|nr:ABC transporter ATP-binding protein [Pseudomonadota bacterium]